MNMETDLEDFKKKQQPALIGTSIRSDDIDTPDEEQTQPIKIKNDLTKLQDSDRSRSTSRPSVINSRISISNDYVSVAELKSEGGLLADEEGELLEDILDDEGHFKGGALQITEQQKELEKMKKDIKNKIVNLSIEDKHNLAKEQQVFGGDAGKFVAPAAAMSQDLSDFHYDSPTPSNEDGKDKQHEFIKAEDVETLDEILNKVNQGQASGIKADGSSSSSHKKINIQEPIIPDSAIEVDSEKTAPASMREGSSSKLLQEQKRSSSRSAISPFREGTGMHKPHLARGDSYHSGLSHDSTYELLYDEFKTAPTTSTPPLDLSKPIESTERRPRHDPTAAPKITNSSSLNYLRTISRSRSRARNQTTSRSIVTTATGSAIPIQDEIELKNKGKGLIGFSEMADLEDAVNNALKFMESSESVDSGSKISESDDLVKSLNDSISTISGSNVANSNKTDLENVKEEDELDADFSENSTTIKNESIDDTKTDLASPNEKKVDPKQAPNIVPFKTFVTHQVPSDEELNLFREHKSFTTEELPSDTSADISAGKEIQEAEISLIEDNFADEKPTVELGEISAVEPMVELETYELPKVKPMVELPTKEVSKEEFFVKLPLQKEVFDSKNDDIVVQGNESIDLPAKKSIDIEAEEPVIVETPIEEDPEEIVEKQIREPVEEILDLKENDSEKLDVYITKDESLENNQEKLSGDEIPTKEVKTAEYIKKESPIKELEPARDAKNELEITKDLDEPVQKVDLTKDLRAKVSVEKLEESTKELKVSEPAEEETTEEFSVAQPIEVESTKNVSVTEPAKIDTKERKVTELTDVEASKQSEINESVETESTKELKISEPKKIEYTSPLKISASKSTKVVGTSGSAEIESSKELKIDEPVEIKSTNLLKVTESKSTEELTEPAEAEPIETQSTRELKVVAGPTKQEIESVEPAEIESAKNKMVNKLAQDKSLSENSVESTETESVKNLKVIESDKKESTPVEKEVTCSESVENEISEELNVAEPVEPESTKGLNVPEKVETESLKEENITDSVKGGLESVEPPKREVEQFKEDKVIGKAENSDDDLDAILAAAEAELADLKKSSKGSSQFDALLAEVEKEQTAKARSSLSNVTKGSSDGSVYVPKPDKMTFEDEPVYLYTSFAGGFQVMSRTNRLTTILTANKIKFECKDLGTDEEAKKVWRRYSSGKTLPGIVRGKDDFIGNWEAIEEANENYEVRSLIYETY